MDFTLVVSNDRDEDMMYRVVFYTMLIVLVGSFVYVDYQRLAETFPAIVDSLISSTILIFLITILYELILNAEHKKYMNSIEEMIVRIPRRVSHDLESKLVDNFIKEKVGQSILASRINDLDKTKSLERLLVNILNDKSLVTNVFLNMRLMNFKKGGSYELELDETFDMPNGATDFIVAFSANRDVIYKLANYAKGIDKIYVLSPEKIIPTAKELSRVFEFNISFESMSKRVGAKVTKRTLSEEETSEILIGLGISKREMKQLYLVRYRVPDYGTRRTCNIRYHSNETILDGYCYWTPDRLSFIKSIKIDYSEIEKYIDNVKIVEFFMCPTLKIEKNDENCSVSIDINNWIFPGNGVALVWMRNEL